MFNATAYRVTVLLFEGGKRRKLEENHINDESQELLATLFNPASFVCPKMVRCGAKGVRKGTYTRSGTLAELVEPFILFIR